MVNTSKILTVSYGTFSCTLEGFDDSFDTMKAIAEYFRDLASDDRYFGAEPPVPDTEMLARIAEREISRRVVASESEGTYVLRAHSEAPLSRIADGAGHVAAASLSDADQNTDHGISDSVTATQETPSHLLAEDSPVAKEAMNTVIDEAAVEDTPKSGTIESAFDDIEADETEFTDAKETADSHVVPSIDPDSVAAKLQRIRAVVSHGQDVTADEGYNEDEHAIEFGSNTHPAITPDDISNIASTASETLEDTVSELSHALDVDDVQEFTEVEDILHKAAPTLAEQSKQSDDIELQSDSGDKSALENNDDSDISERLTKSLLEDDDSDDEIADFLERMNKSETIDSDIGMDDFDDADDDDAYSIFADEEDATEDTIVPVEKPQPAPIRARVLKMKRTDFEAAVAQGHLEEEIDDDTAPAHEGNADLEADVATTLSIDDEADLRRELAEVHAESELDTHVAESDADIMAQDAPIETDSRPRASLAPQNHDSDVSRILAETNNQLEEPEGKTRRNAIAHLRAAVAATQAEKDAGNDTTIKADTSGAYREDLADIVRPRRPVAATNQQRDQRPAAPAAAPLKLVAEQRVDPEGAPSRQPVRPRRVSMAQMAAESELAAKAQGTPDENDYGTFSEFAEEVGATKLPDLLEAAAAYLAFVEGREKFSRPQLMTKVRQVEKDDFSREDGLRSFGQLLRQGKIQKLKGGRFTVSERIGYKPDERYVG